MLTRRGLLRAGSGALGVAAGIPFVSSARAADEGVKIGVLNAVSGAYADIGGRGSVVAAQMAIADFGGSVLGKPVAIVSADHQSKPDIGLTIARQWIDRDGVDMILDLSTSPVALAVQGLGASKNRITIVSSGSVDALTGEQCSPYGAHWTYDSYSIAKVVSSALARSGSTWFFITVDNAGGHSLEAALTPFLKANGARILGSARHPLNTADMSSFLLQAQSSGANYIALANAGADMIGTVKQAQEFGITQAGQTLVGTATFLTDLKAMGLEAANGLVYGTAFYSGISPAAEEWSKRFFALHKAMPNDVQAGNYSAVLHYLKAVKATGTKDAATVMASMRETPVDDFFARGGTLRKDGRMVHEMYVVKAKKPSASTGPWDLVDLVKTVPGAEAFRPLAESKCPLVKT